MLFVLSAFKKKMIKEIKNEEKNKEKNETTIIGIPFSGLGLHGGYRGDEWFKYRINIFHNYTLKALLNQKDKNFIIWCQFRPEEETNPLTQTIKKPHPPIFTYNGINFWDDKYPQDKLWERLRDMLPKLKEIVGDKDVKLMINGSDDMYGEDAVEGINNEPLEEGIALTHRNGYVYNSDKGRLAEWHPVTNPPFYCLMFKNETFLNTDKHYDYVKTIKSHEYVISEMKEKRMPDGRFCVTTHSNNISTFFDHPFMANEVYYEDIKNLTLKKFGL